MTAPLNWFASVQSRVQRHQNRRALVWARRWHMSARWHMSCQISEWRDNETKRSGTRVRWEVDGRRRTDRRTYRSFVADHKATSFDTGADGHLGSFNVDQALEAGVTSLRVRQVLGFEDEFACDAARHQHVLHIRRTTEARAEASAMRVQMGRILLRLFQLLTLIKT